MSDAFEANTREPVPSAPRADGRKSGSILRLAVAGAIIVAALAFLLFKGLDDATLYFRTASEAVAQRALLGEDRFRLEGTVVEGSISQVGEFTDFVIEDKGVTVPVRNSGQPVGIFQENIPVVLEGHFVEGSDVYQSDRIMVRHDNDYSQEYPERVSGAANQ